MWDMWDMWDMQAKPTRGLGDDHHLADRGYRP